MEKTIVTQDGLPGGINQGEICVEVWIRSVTQRLVDINGAVGLVPNRWPHRPYRVAGNGRKDVFPFQIWAGNGSMRFVPCWALSARRLER